VYETAIEPFTAAIRITTSAATVEAAADLAALDLKGAGLLVDLRVLTFARVRNAEATGAVAC